MTISRRTFLIGTGGVLAVGIATKRATERARQRPVVQWAEDISGTTSTEDLGIEYLTRNPAEADRAVLFSHLASLVPSISLLGGTERASDWFHEQVYRDFLEGDILRMGGWMLSRTELRLCALVALEGVEQTGTSGVFSPQPLPNGDTLYWTAPVARFTLPEGSSALELKLQSGTREPQRVTVRIGGETVAELLVWGRAWQRAYYVMRHSGDSALEIELITTPEWKPGNDFRTIGIGLDRIYRNTADRPT